MGAIPNTYTNILWCFGLHDRPWSEREIFGMTRSMNLEGMRRKTDVDAYIPRDSYEGRHHRRIGLHRARHRGASARERPQSSLRFRCGLRPAPKLFAGCDAVVHLAGEPVAQRWTRGGERTHYRTAASKAREPWSPRFGSSRRLCWSALPPIGYYGSRGDEILTEDSPPGADFLGQVAVAWEQEARAAEEFGVRVVTPRIGVVLGRGGGALAKMALPFRFGVGGRLGTASSGVMDSLGRSGRAGRICDRESQP